MVPNVSNFAALYRICTVCLCRPIMNMDLRHTDTLTLSLSTTKFCSSRHFPYGTEHISNISSQKANTERKKKEEKKKGKIAGPELGNLPSRSEREGYTDRE